MFKTYPKLSHQIRQGNRNIRFIELHVAPVISGNKMNRFSNWDTKMDWQETDSTLIGRSWRWLTNSISWSVQISITHSVSPFPGDIFLISLSFYHCLCLSGCLCLSKHTAIGWRTFGKNWDIFKSKMPIGLMRKIYNQCVIPTITYGDETWKLTKQTDNLLGVARMNDNRWRKRLIDWH